MGFFSSETISKEEYDRVLKDSLGYKNELIEVKSELTKTKAELDIANHNLSIKDGYILELEDETDYKKLERENSALKEELKGLKFEKEHNEEVILLKDNIAALENKINLKCQEYEALGTIKDDEIVHLKKLLDTYRALPDVQNMIDTIQTIAVPSVEQLKEISEIYKSVDNTNLEHAITEMGNDIREVLGKLLSNYQRMDSDLHYIMRTGRF